MTHAIRFLLFAFTTVTAAAAEDAASLDRSQKKISMNAAQQMFDGMVGKWTGACRTWFEPGKLVDESPIDGEFYRVLEADFLRHEYSSTIKGKPRTGEETLAFNPIKKKFESSWIDTFHMNYAIMFSEGNATEDGFFLLGGYDVEPDQPSWGWKTIYQRIDADHLTITALNISPSGEEAKAVEIQYTRVE